MQEQLIDNLETKRHKTKQNNNTWWVDFERRVRFYVHIY